MATYKNIPVDEDTYIAVKLIAETNGFGSRGMGAQVKQWVIREMPECEHEKTPVTIEIFPSQDTLPGTNLHRTGWYCETCKRVYQRVENKGELDEAITRSAKAKARKTA